ncbi:MAG TPA: hypothetical protein PLI27_07990 [Ignavibacteriales bacterium]|nr:hypothetical protein [Ignavibacteriales bacterium]HPD67997.1 hypothetical protein [Ignavibacteriales bacterium]
MKKLIILLCISFISFAQLKVVSSNVIVPEREAFYPLFDKTNSAIYYTTPNCVGIYKFDLKTEKSEVITNEAGAGYEFKITDDNKIVYRCDTYKDGFKYSTLKIKDLKSGESKSLVENQRFVSPPEVPQKDYIVYNIEKSSKVYKISAKKLQKTLSSTYVMNEDLKIALYRNGQKKILKPVGDDHYIWVSLSPDKQKLLFTASKKGTFITDLNGKILYEIGTAQAPKWSNDGTKVLFMMQKDDGHRFTHSDLYYYDLKERKSYQLTFTDDVIELYPSWSYDDKQVVCNTEKGEIIIYQLENSK